MFICLSGFVSKRENQGLYEYQQKKMGYKFSECENQPQSYLKIPLSWNNPYLECFYLGIQVGSTDTNNVFDCCKHLWPGTTRWPLQKRLFWEYRSAENFKSMDSRSLPSSMICSIYIYVNSLESNHVLLARPQDMNDIPFGGTFLMSSKQCEERLMNKHNFQRWSQSDAKKENRDGRLFCHNCDRVAIHAQPSDLSPLF